MSTEQRRTVLGMLVLSGMLFHLTYSAIEAMAYEVSFADASPLLGGALIAQAGLLAVWAGLGNQPLAGRMPPAFGISALFGLGLVWGSERSSQGTDMTPVAILMLLLVVVQSLLLLVVRRFWKWKIGASMDDAGADTSSFRIRQLFLWTAATATLLALARWIVPEESLAVEEGFEGALMVLFATPIFAAISLPLVIPSVALVLGHRRRIRAAAWLIGMTVVTGSAFFLVSGLTNWGRQWTNVSWEEVIEVAQVDLMVHVGLVTTVLTGLVVVRLAGLHLVQRRKGDGRKGDGGNRVRDDAWLAT